VKPPSEQEVRAWLALPPFSVVEFKPDPDADATLQEQLEEMHYKVLPYSSITLYTVYLYI
jgi:hypothetical protein